MGAPVRRRLAWRLRCWADRIDRAGAVRVTSMTLTLEKGEGWRLREDGRGMKVCYLGEAEYDKAHTEADDPPYRIDWTTMKVYAPGTSLVEP